jgi:hypothetical protein
MLPVYILTSPIRASLEALMFYLSEWPSNAIPSTKCIVDLAELVLTSNYFLFRGDFFLQIKRGSDEEH